VGDAAKGNRRRSRTATRGPPGIRLGQPTSRMVEVCRGGGGSGPPEGKDQKRAYSKTCDRAQKTRPAPGELKKNWGEPRSPCKKEKGLHKSFKFRHGKNEDLASHEKKKKKKNTKKKEPPRSGWRLCNLNPFGDKKEEKND